MFQKFNDKSWVAILAFLKQRVQFLWKMRRLGFVHADLLHNAVRLILEEKNIATLVNNPTSNAYLVYRTFENKSSRKNQ